MLFILTSEEGSGTDRSLPAAGIDNAILLGLWVGGGALVLAGGAVAVADRAIATARSTWASDPPEDVPGKITPGPRPGSIRVTP